jgi:membrane fusion protein, heavy metal efflux system
MKKIIILINTVLLVASCSSKKEQQIAEVNMPENMVVLSEAQLKNAGLLLGKMEKHSIASVLKVSGKIDVPPQNMVSISVPLGGYVRSAKLLPGMPVSKGQILAVIEDQQYIQIQQDYLTAKAQLAYSESDFKRQRELNQSKATSDKVFEQSKSTYNAQTVLVNSLAQKLKLIGISPGSIGAGSISRSINIYSPISGFVSAVNVNIGKYVSPADVLFELINPSDIHLALTVFEKDMDKLFIGQKLMAYTNGQSDKQYPCTVILISKNMSNESSSVVHCHFEQYDKTLLPGMFMNADVDVKNNEVNALPDEAIVRFENKQYAFIAKGKNQFEMLEIKTGNAENGFTAVNIDETLAKETFVLKGAYNLLMKLKNIADE